MGMMICADAGAHVPTAPSMPLPRSLEGEGEGTTPDDIPDDIPDDTAPTPAPNSTDDVPPTPAPAPPTQAPASPTAAETPTGDASGCGEIVPRHTWMPVVLSIFAVN